LDIPFCRKSHSSLFRLEGTVLELLGGFFCAAQGSLLPLQGSEQSQAILEAIGEILLLGILMQESVLLS
jgi:hypothetical protein